LIGRALGNEDLVRGGLQQRTLGTDDAWRSAARLFGQALETDSASAARWCDYGDALAQLGATGKAEYSFRRGVELAPTSPDILLDIADFYFNDHQHLKALPYFSRILALINEYDARVFSY